MKKSLKNIKIWALLAFLLIFIASLIWLTKTTGQSETELIVPATALQTEDAEPNAVPEADYIFQVTRPESAIRVRHIGGTAGGSLPDANGNFSTAIDNAITAAKNVKPNAIIEFKFTTGTALSIGSEYARLKGGIFIVSGNIIGSGSSLFRLQDNDVDLYITSGTLTNTSSGCVIINTTDGTVNILGGTIQNTGDGEAIYNSRNGTINVTDCTISTKTGSAIRNFSGGSIITSNATITSSSGNFNATIYNGYNGTVTISNCTVKNNLNDYYAYAVSGSDDGSSIAITGGTISAFNNNCNAIRGEAGKVTLSGKPQITGVIFVKAGVLETISGFTPHTSGYIIFIYEGKENDIAVRNGRTHINYFQPASNMQFFLKIQGTNIVITRDSRTDGSVSVSISGWTYGDSPNNPLPAITKGDYTNITYNYTGRNGTVYNNSQPPSNAGDYRVTATFHQTAAYNTATAYADFTITAKEIEITLDNSEKVYGNSDPAFSYAITGGSIIEGDNLGITGITRKQGEDAGIYTVYITWSNTNYIVTASVDFTITPKEIVIIIKDASKALGADDPEFDCTVPNNGLIGSDTLGNVTYERIEGEELGTYSIYSITWDNLNYSAANIIPGTLTIHKNLQDPLYITSSNTHMFGTNYEITAEGGSLEGVVRFEIIGGSGTGFIDGNILIIYTEGTFILRAIIDGDEDYEPVASEEFTLTVTLQKFMISFLNFEGSLIKRVEAEYGINISSLLPDNPIRAGYEFARWEGYLAGMTVTGDAVFTAMYTLAPGQKYTVNFYDENSAALIKSVQAIKGADISLLFPAPPSKPGFEFARWDTYNPGMTVSGNLSFKAVYTPASEQKYTVTFLDENGGIIKIIPNIIKGTNVATLFPSNPVKTSTTEFTYAFKGWQGYTLGDTVNEDVTLTASFTAALNTYTVIFKDYNGNLIESFLLGYGETIIPPNNPVREGYEFIRWEGFIDGITATGNATYMAVYSLVTVSQFTVTFYDEDDFIVIFQTLALEGASIASLLPVPPVKEGFVFVRWEGYTAGLIVTGNLSFTAVYAIDTEETFSVTFLDDDGTVIKIIYDAVKGTDVSMLLPLNPSKESSMKYTYEFAGWQGYTAGDTVQTDLTFTAIYTETLITYLIIFKDYNTSILAFYMLAYGETIIPPLKPEREGYEFIRWEGFTDGLTVSGNAVFTAVYTLVSSEKFTVTFYDEDETTIISQTEEYGGESISALLPVPPQKEGFVFVRWEGYTAGLTVTKNLSFKAVYAHATEETFTVTFLDDDGTVIKVVYDVVKGSDISTLLPADPFKPATAEFTYYFRGWYGFTIGDIIGGNLTLTASYTAVINTYTISFHDEDGGILALFGAEYGTLISEFLIEPPVKEGFVFARWRGYTAGMVLTSDVVFTAVYVEEGAELYIITFYDEDGETIIAQVQALNGTDISTILPEPPVKEGFVFARWEGYLAGMTVDRDLAFTAVYTAENEQLYTVIFLDDNETVIKILFDIVKGTDISTLFPTPPNKAWTAEFTYTFTGWFDYNASDIVEGNLIFIAVYVETINTYTVNFIDWDGTVIKTEKLNYGDTITLPEELPYREDYEFIRWENFINGMKVTQEISFTAVYAFEPETYTLTFYDTDGATVILQVSVPEGSNIDLLLPIPPHKEDFEFARWEGYTLGITVDHDLDFYAVYTPVNEEKFTVTLIDDEGNIILIITDVVKGSDISALLPADSPVKAPTAKYAYVFNGWYGFSYGDTVETDITLIAAYTEVLKTYTVTFLNWDGAEIEVATAAYGAHISELFPDNTERSSTAEFTYIFSGWKGYFNGMTVAGNISFIASYTEELNKYIITFLNWDGSTLYQITVFYGESIIYETIPIRTGYTFFGWDKLTENITEDLIITALYSANEYVIIINNGENESEITFEYGTEFTLPNDPIKEGYIFEGWYLDEECTVKCDFNSLPAENLTIYAKWTKESGFPVYVIIILVLVFIIILLSVILSVKKSKTRKVKKFIDSAKL